MPPNSSPAKLVGIAIALIFGGLGIPSFQACHSTKFRAERTPGREGAITPLIQRRAATKADFDSGVAIFYIADGHNAPYSLGHDLPIRAEIVKSDGMDWPVGTRVSVVQAEITDGKHVTLGVLNGDERGVCALEDVKLLE